MSSSSTAGMRRITRALSAHGQFLLGFWTAGGQHFGMVVVQEEQESGRVATVWWCWLSSERATVHPEYTGQITIGLSDVITENITTLDEDIMDIAGLLRPGGRGWLALLQVQYYVWDVFHQILHSTALRRHNTNVRGRDEPFRQAPQAILRGFLVIKWIRHRWEQIWHWNTPNTPRLSPFGFNHTPGLSQLKHTSRAKLTTPISCPIHPVLQLALTTKVSAWRHDPHLPRHNQAAACRIAAWPMQLRSKLVILYGDVYPAVVRTLYIKTTTDQTTTNIQISTILIAFGTKKGDSRRRCCLPSSLPAISFWYVDQCRWEQIKSATSREKAWAGNAN